MKLKYLFYFLMAVMLLESCSKDDPRDVLSLKLNRTRLELAKGATKQLVATVTPYVEEPVMWKSTMPDVATVDSTGFVTAIGEGKTVITASMRDLTASCELTVINVAVDSVVLYRDELKLGPGDTYTMKATVVPAAAPQDVEWRSDNEQVATVDEEGVITAIALGTAKIYAKAGDKEAYCTVDVSNTVATFEELKEMFASTEPGRTVTITLTNNIDITETLEIAQENELAREFVIDGGGEFSLKWLSSKPILKLGKNQSLIFKNVTLDGNSMSPWDYFFYIQGGTMTLDEGTVLKNLASWGICTFRNIVDDESEEIAYATLFVNEGVSITGNSSLQAATIDMSSNDGRLVLRGGNISDNGSRYIRISRGVSNPTGKIYVANALSENSCFDLYVQYPQNGSVIVEGWEGYMLTEADLAKFVLKDTSGELYLENGVIKLRIP